MPSKLVEAQCREAFALVIAKLDAEPRRIFDSYPQNLRDMLYTFFEEGFMDGGKCGAMMAFDSIKELKGE